MAVRKGCCLGFGNCRRHTLAPLAEALKTDISAVRLWAAVLWLKWQV